MKSNVVYLAAVCAGTLVVAGCTSDQPSAVPPDSYVPEVKTVQTAPPPASKKTQSEQVEEAEFDIVSAPAPEKKAAKPVAVKPAAPKKVDKRDFETVYVVKPGDTLSGIAYANHLNMYALADYNGLDLSKPLYAGKKIRIPKVRNVKPAAAKTTAAAKPAHAAKSVKKTGTPAANETVYVIKNGDTLGGIALRHHVRRKELAARNGLNENSILRIGQKLIIPKASLKTAAKAKPAQKKATVTAAPAPAAAPAETTDAAPAAAPTAGSTLTADEIIGTGDTVPGGAGESSSSPSTAKASAPAPASAADGDTIGFCCTQDMTLQEVADAVGRDYERLKKLNPSLSPTEKLKSGTTVQIYIF